MRGSFIDYISLDNIAKSNFLNTWFRLFGDGDFKPKYRLHVICDFYYTAMSVDINEFDKYLQKNNISYLTERALSTEHRFFVNPYQRDAFYYIQERDMIMLKLLSDYEFKSGEFYY